MSVVATDDVEAERAYWETVAGAEDVWAETWSVPGVEDWEAGVETCLRHIVPHLELEKRPGATVLDLGCGIGRLTLPLAERYPNASFIGVDISPAMLRIARRGARLLGNARFVTGDGRSLPRSVSGLDAAYSMLTLQHIPAEAQEGYIRAIAQRLKPGGVLRVQYVMTPVDHFLSHGVAPLLMMQWCQDAGLTPLSTDLNLIAESWAWTTAVKR